MAEWGMGMAQACALTDRQVEALLGAYVQRKKFEARILIGTLGEAMQRKPQHAPLSTLAALGFGIEGAADGF